MHKYNLDDEVYYPIDRAPFKIVGIRKDQVEIEGDFSGGTHNVRQRDWVSPDDVEPFDWAKVVTEKGFTVMEGRG